MLRARLHFLLASSSPEVSQREREREGERKRERERERREREKERERERERVFERGGERCRIWLLYFYF
jgi:hypothetical protein